MSLFICAKCGCVDNTAVSSYWSLMNVRYRNIRYDGDLQKYAGKPLCSECGLLKFDKHDNPIVTPGRWHGHFPKVKATEEQIAKCNKDTGIIEY